MTLLGASEAQAAWLALALTGVALLLVSVADQQPARRREAEPVFKLTSDDSSSSGPLLPAAAALTPLEDSGKELVWVCGGNVPVNWQKHDVCADLAGCNASTTGSPCDGGPQTPFCNVEPAGSQPAGGASTTWQSYIRATPDLELGQWAGLDVEGNFLLNAATAGANASAAAAGSARLEASCGAAYGRLTQSLGPGGFGLRSRADARRLLAGRKVLLTGDSTLHETFNELCDFIGATPNMASPPADGSCNQDSGMLECSAGTGADAATLAFDWTAFGEFPPHYFAAGTKGMCEEPRGEHHRINAHYNNNSAASFFEQYDVVVISFGMWHVGPTCAANTTDPLASTQQLLQAYATATAAADATVMPMPMPRLILRSPLPIGALGTWNWKPGAARFPEVNEYLAAVRDRMRGLVEVFQPQLPSDRLGFVDAMSWLQEGGGDGEHQPASASSSPSGTESQKSMVGAASAEARMLEITSSATDKVGIMSVLVEAEGLLFGKDPAVPVAASLRAPPVASAQQMQMLRTRCPIFDAGNDDCGCHMAHQLGWSALAQQLLNVL